MTGPVVPPGGEELREAIVRVLCDGGHCGTCKRRAAELLPVFLAFAEEQGRRRAAEELRAIGRAGLAASPGAHPVRVPVSYLFDRAAALAPENARPE